MFGRRHRRPATKGETLFVGVFMTAVGGLLSLAMLSIEPEPDAPALLIIGATLFALFVFLCGLWILATALRMFTRQER